MDTFSIDLSAWVVPTTIPQSPDEQRNDLTAANTDDMLADTVPSNPWCRPFLMVGYVMGHVVWDGNIPPSIVWQRPA
jgi:hypothetical protein